MYTINEQFAKASRQFADNAAEANRILLQNAENAFALQLATFEQNANAAFAFIGLLLAWFTPPRRGVATALLALLIPVAGLGYGYYLRTQAQQNPIHDISTDLVDPPAFSGAVATARSRVTSGNDLDLLNKRLPDGRAYVEAQREIYPDIVSIANTAINQTGQAVEGIAIIMAAYLTISLSISLLMNWYNARVALKGG